MACTRLATSCCYLHYSRSFPTISQPFLVQIPWRVSRRKWQALRRTAITRRYWDTMLITFRVQTRGCYRSRKNLFIDLGIRGIGNLRNWNSGEGNTLVCLFFSGMNALGWEIMNNKCVNLYNARVFCIFVSVWEFTNIRFVWNVSLCKMLRGKSGTCKCVSTQMGGGGAVSECWLYAFEMRSDVWLFRYPPRRTRRWGSIEILFGQNE